jgi:hypothetical protein
MIQRKSRTTSSPTSDLNGFVPDWTMLGNPERFESELIGFKFKGPGWYTFTNKKNGKTDTILVIPVREGSNLFRLHVYNERNPIESFNWVLSAPVCVDERCLMKA